MGSATVKATEEVEKSEKKLSALGEKELNASKKTLEKTLNDLVSYQHLKIREKSPLKVDYFNLTIEVGDMRFWPRFWNVTKITGLKVTKYLNDGERQVLYEQTGRISENEIIKFEDEEYKYKLTFVLIETGVFERDQSHIKISREKKSG